MLKLLGGFLLVQVLYHVLVVGISYGGEWISQTYLAILRDVTRIFLVGVFFIVHRKAVKSFFQQWWKEVMLFVLVLIFALGVSFFWFEKSLQDMLIGVKYGLWYRGILLMAIGLWRILIDKNKKSDFSSLSYQKVFAWSLVSVVILGWIWQFLKLFFPDWFYDFWYGGLDDFHFGEKPPIYYLTGFEGTLRWQGIFAGPNNYGYFLVAFLPLILTFFPLRLKALYKRKKADWISFFVQILWGLTIAFTLSRAAMIGIFVVLVLQYWKAIWSHKKLLFSLWIFLVLLVGALSLWKWESTSIHIFKKLEGFQEVFAHPLGYGLGSSGPAIHHQGRFLPENYYVQLMLDIGIPGFLLRLWMLMSFFCKQRKIAHKFQEKKPENSDFFLLFSAFQKGFLALLVIGLFLHVFEDSMVNYIFFVSYGLVLGWLSALSKTEKAW